MAKWGKKAPSYHFNYLDRSNSLCFLHEKDSRILDYGCSGGFYPVPKEKSSEFFEFYAISNRFASIFGPLGSGFIRDILGNIRYSILFLTVFFIIGMIILVTIELKK